MTLTALYSPDWDTRPEPETAVLLLHGYGSNERDLPGIAQYLGLDAPLASLRAPLDMGSGAYAWFPLDDDDWLEPAPVNAATNALWEWIDQNVSPATRLVVVGFSQGGCMASQLLRSRPERISHTVIFSGFVLDTVQPADARLSELMPPVFWGRGTVDTIIPATLVAHAAGWLPQHTTLTEKVYPGLGHSVNDRELADAQDFLSRG